jgi:DNA-binding MarR family transcriptional regulator
MSKQKHNPQSDSFGYWLFRVHRAMQAAFTHRLRLLGVTGAEWGILGQLVQGNVTPIVLARHLGVDRAAVTRFIDHLEGKRLVRRTSHPTDGRSTIVELTTAGENLLPKLVAASKETNREFLTLLEPEEAESLRTILRKLGERLPEQVFPVADCDN